MKRENAWYLKEIVALRTIMGTDTDIESMISRGYLNEKLDRIISGRGVNIHPVLHEISDNLFNQIQKGKLYEQGFDVMQAEWDWFTDEQKERITKGLVKIGLWDDDMLGCENP